MASKQSGNIDKIPKVNKGHIGNNKWCELIHGTMGETSNSSGAISFVMIKRLDDRSDEAKRHLGKVIGSVILHKLGRPNRSGGAKKQSSEANNYSGRAKKYN